MATLPQQSQAWTPPAARVDGDRLLRAKAAEQRAAEALAEARKVAAEAKQEDQSVKEELADLKAEIAALKQDLPKIIPGGGGKRMVAKVLEREHIGRTVQRQAASLSSLSKYPAEGLLPFRTFNPPASALSSTYPEIEVVGIGEGLHQAFGNGTRDPVTGRVYTTWRAGTEHGVPGAGQIRMRRFDGATPVTEPDGGGAYQIVEVPAEGRDLRNPAICVDPVTRNLVLVFSDTPTSGSGTTYFKRKISTDGGNTWGAAATFKPIGFPGARLYGALRYQVSTDSTRLGELIVSAYYPLVGNPNVVDYFVSRDGGVTFQNSQDLGESYVTSTDGKTETSLVGVSATLWLAFGRGSDTIHMKVSTDGRKTWSDWETLQETVSGTHVEPDAILAPDASGRPCILLVMADRSADRVDVTSATVSDLVQYGAAAFPPHTLTFSSTNAFPCLIDFGDGNALVQFNKEFGQTLASVHLGYLNYGKFLNRRPGFRCGLSAAWTGITAGGAAQPIVWNSFNPGFLYGFTHSGGVFTCKRPGIYTFGWRAQVTAGNASGANAFCYIQRNGTDLAYDVWPAPASGGYSIGTEPVDINCNFGDQIACLVQFTGGTARTISNAASTRFIGRYVGDYG